MLLIISYFVNLVNCVGSTPIIVMDLEQDRGQQSRTEDGSLS